MKTSDEGLKQLAEAEGTVLHIYSDAAGLETVGTGHLLTEFEKRSGVFKNGITQAQAMNLLKTDVIKAEMPINQLVKVPLTQSQFDALVLFVFNVGASAFRTSTLLKKLNQGDYEAVPEQLMRWNKVKNPKTKVLEPTAGLTKRRRREIALWNKS